MQVVHTTRATLLALARSRKNRSRKTRSSAMRDDTIRSNPRHRRIRSALVVCSLTAGVLGVQPPSAHADPPSSVVENHWELLPQTYSGLTGSTTMPVHRGVLPGGTTKFDPAPTATFVLVAKVSLGFSGWTVALRDATGATIASMDLTSTTSGYEVFPVTVSWPSSDRVVADIRATEQTGNTRILDIKKAYVELRQSGTIKKIAGRYPIGVRQDAITSTSWADVADPIFYRHNAHEFDPAPTVRLRVSGRASQSCARLESRLVNTSGTAAGSPVSNGGTAWFSNSDTVSLTNGTTYRLQARLQNPGCPLGLTADLLSADLVFEQSTADANGITRTVSFYPGVSAATESSMTGAELDFPFIAPGNEADAQAASVSVSMKRISGSSNAGVTLADLTVITTSGSYALLEALAASLPGPGTELDTATIISSSTTGRVSQSVLRETLWLRSSVGVTHSPPHQAPEPPATAGVPLELSATIHDACETACSPLGIGYSLVYDAPWGQEQIDGLIADPDPSNPVTFEVPANAVRYGDFRYHLEAWRTVDQVMRSPAAGQFSIPVVNRLDVVVTEPDGSPFDQADWTLEVIDTSTDPSTYTVVATGTTDSDGVILVDLPATSAVTSAAAFNGGIANYRLEVNGTPGSDLLMQVHRFFVNYTEPDMGAATPGTSTSPGEAIQTEVVDGEPMEAAGCADEAWVVPDPGSNDVAPGQKWGKVAWVNGVYGAHSEYTYGQKAESAYEVAIKIGEGPWRSSGQFGASVHNVNNVAVGWIVKPHPDSPTQSREKHVDVRFRMEWRHVQFYHFVTGECIRADEKYPTTWVEASQRVSTDLIGVRPNDCSITCTKWPHIALQRDPEAVFTTSAERAYRHHAGICIVVCLAGQSGYSTYSQIRITFLTDCAQWWIYGDGKQSAIDANVKLLDAGDRDEGVSSGYPTGCGPQAP